MPEILTESFCERCGTRYTFESAQSRTARLKGIKVLSRGLKNFVMSDDTSMDEAMAAARSETDREATAQQLDAFHKTFNFCMNCRQYTCGNCWNETEGQCLSCSPHLGHEILPAPFPDLDATIAPIGAGASNGADGNGHSAETLAGPLAWPSSDLMLEAEAAPSIPADRVEPAAFDDLESIDAAARLAALGAVDAVAESPADEIEAGPPLVTPAPEVEAAEAAPEVEAAAAAPEVEAAGAATPVGEAVPDSPAGDQDPAGRAAIAAGQTSALLHRFRPGQNLDDEIAAFERQQAEAEAEAEARRAAEAAMVAAAGAASVAREVEPESVAVEAATAPPQPVADEPQPVAEPVAAAPEPLAEPQPVAASDSPVEPEPSAPPPAAPDDVVPQPTWQIVAPDTPTADGIRPPAAPVPTPEAEPQWPTQPEWPSRRPSDGLAFLGRPAATGSPLDSLWAESAREVVSAPPPAAARPTSGVAPCVSCGLSLSATARFCRRCGTRQG